MKITLITLLALGLCLVGCGKKEAPKQQAEANATVTPNPEPPKAAAEKLITNPIVEKAIRKELKKPTGALTKADLAKVTLLSLDDGPKITDADLKEVAKLQQLKVLNLGDTKITDAGLKELAKLQKLEGLDLIATKSNRPHVTKAGVVELQQALPNCYIHSNPTK